MNEYISAWVVCARCSMLDCVRVQILTEEWCVAKQVGRINWHRTLDDKNFTDRGERCEMEQKKKK